MSKSIKLELLSGLKWVAMGRLFTQLISWSMTFFVLRLLSPSDYGLVALSGAIWFCRRHHPGARHRKKPACQPVRLCAFAQYRFYPALGGNGALDRTILFGTKTKPHHSGRLLPICDKCLRHTARCAFTARNAFSGIDQDRFFIGYFRWRFDTGVCL
jgi:hypothetical protein